MYTLVTANPTCNLVNLMWWLRLFFSSSGDLPSNTLLYWSALNLDAGGRGVLEQCWVGVSFATFSPLLAILSPHLKCKETTNSFMQHPNLYVV